MRRTLRFKINLQKEEYLNLLEQCNKLYNFYTKWAFDNKTYNKNICHEKTYKQLVESTKIKTALIQTVRDTALESCKAVKLKGKVPQKKKYSSIRLDKRCFNIRNKQITIIGILKRSKNLLFVPEYYKEVYYNWNQKGAQLCYDKHNKQFWVNITFEKENPKLLNNTDILGIDRGLYNIITLSNGKLFKSNKIRKQKRKFLYNRKKLQQKGTKSAKRKLRKLSGKEKRFMKDVNHCITKYLVNLNYNIYVIEKLTGIRQQRRGKKINSWISNWSFYQFEQLLKYKAEALGKQVKYISPKYTSQKCSRCKNMHSINRHKSHFKCVTCGYYDHADINAAKNIHDNYIFSIIPKESIEQAQVNKPIVSTLIS